MTPISHGGPEPIVFASMNGFTCSICAPNGTVKAEVEAFAVTKFPGVWESINKANMGMGQPTPNPCNIEPALRTHWFLMRMKP